MSAKLVVPASQRDEFFWQLLALLDHVETTERFVDELLSQIGVQGTDRARVASALRARLPAEVGEIEASTVATVLEDNGVLSWANDLRLIPTEVFAALEAAVTTVLRGAARGAMPSTVADALVAETTRILDNLVDGAGAQALRSELLTILERDLWRRDTAERRIVSTLCRAVAKHARIAPKGS